MAKRINVDVRRELVRAIGERYRFGSVDGKARIQDEFVTVTGYHRKHSIRVLNSAAAATVTARHNGSGFINEMVLAYCKAEGIEFTRGRPHRKNDQAWVEQQNGTVVRRHRHATAPSSPDRAAR